MSDNVRKTTTFLHCSRLESSVVAYNFCWRTHFTCNLKSFNMVLLTSSQVSVAISSAIGKFSPVRDLAKEEQIGLTCC